MTPLIAQAERKRGQIAPKDEARRIAANIAKLPGVFDNRAVSNYAFDADAPLASARVTPAIPNTGKAFLRRLLFKMRFDTAQFPGPFGHIGPIAKLGLSGVVPGRHARRRRSLRY